MKGWYRCHVSFLYWKWQDRRKPCHFNWNAFSTSSAFELIIPELIKYPFGFKKSFVISANGIITSAKIFAVIRSNFPFKRSLAFWSFSTSHQRKPHPVLATSKTFILSCVFNPSKQISEHNLLTVQFSLDTFIALLSISVPITKSAPVEKNCLGDWFCYIATR